MNEMPCNFSTPPHEYPHKYFKNLCSEFKKILNESQDKELLQQEMEKFLNAAKQMLWNHSSVKPTVKHEEGEKAIAKIFDRFKRYIEILEIEAKKANIQDLLEAIEQIETMISDFDIA